MSVQSRAVESLPASLSPYLKFKLALKSREVRRQYPNLLERFQGPRGLLGIQGPAGLIGNTGAIDLPGPKR
jgi:hypothetical protein